MSFNRRSTTGSLDPARVRTDGTKTSGDPTEERLRARVKKNSAYEKYKASLHEFFDGDKPLPDNLKTLLATRPGAEEHLGKEAVAEQEATEEAARATVKADSKKKAEDKAAAVPERRPRRRVTTRNDYAPLIKGVRQASSPREVEGAVDALLAAGYPLPSDAEILSKALGHSDEGVIEKALTGLLELAGTDEIKSPRLLRTRIDNVALLASSSDLTSLCEQLKQRL